MSKINLPPFYVGQRVVYITGINMPKNSVHTIRAIGQSPCGCWIVNVNNVEYNEEVSVGEWASCNYCNKAFIKTSVHGFFSTSFRPLKEQKAPLMTFYEIKEFEQEEVLIVN